MHSIQSCQASFGHTDISRKHNSVVESSEFSGYVVVPVAGTATQGATEASNDFQTACNPSMCPEEKHLAKRPVGEWGVYGGYGRAIWSHEFERVVLDAIVKIEKERWNADRLICHIEAERKHIARKRLTDGFRDFGVRRNRPEDEEKNHLSYTSLCSSRYCHGMYRAVSLAYDGKNYVKEQGPLTQLFQQRFSGSTHQLRYGQVRGYINGEGIPLTQYVFCPRIKEHQRFESEKWFGNEDDYYMGSNLEAAVWLHTDRHLIPKVMSHVQKLVDQGLDGDLTVIPRIHWWYVHLAPIYRGSGGAAEMLVNTLCRLQKVDLPAWAGGIAPSVEVLLEPDEEEFCRNYYRLFSADQDALKKLFI